MPCCHAAAKKQDPVNSYSLCNNIRLGHCNNILINYNTVIGFVFFKIYVLRKILSIFSVRKPMTQQM